MINTMCKAKTHEKILSNELLDVLVVSQLFEYEGNFEMAGGKLSEISVRLLISLIR